MTDTGSLVLIFGVLFMSILVSVSVAGFALAAVRSKS